MSNTFTCCDCGETKPVSHEGGTGYATDRNGSTICYACCAIRDSADMERNGKATLYLATNDTGHKVITNWPGTMSYAAQEVRRFNHPFAREAWLGVFRDSAGAVWRFKNIGDSQLAHCKRASKR